MTEESFERSEKLEYFDRLTAFIKSGKTSKPGPSAYDVFVKEVKIPCTFHTSIAMLV